ncbi:dolichol-phosphate mannosyltransferase subunit 3 [Coemansia reversa NRRL 1564]|uniref:Dolichol-phosphate mannosyltransferase subunit 3 n=1 Tax=Coemansia reversa (strain ATCC 12441 / NRRL 1564) TaxID=763665 RepID=A0A2G5B7R8_COERN|nr:dolichol-phosphate mannosyltransferase subunit 3 [Coemansia reversa NRRL 1564]|eukprot:PIA15040.1 dolichol-phosphate mannosyltransferase subunit 3 [Coemansia reversa NRRL 1564]
MTRAHRIATTFTIAAVTWLLGLFGLFPLSETIQSQIWPVLPLFFIVALGSYAFINVGYNLLVFRECPEAFHELMQEIQEAKHDLRAKGVDVA